MLPFCPYFLFLLNFFTSFNFTQCKKNCHTDCIFNVSCSLYNGLRTDVETSRYCFSLYEVSHYTVALYEVSSSKVAVALKRYAIFSLSFPID